MMGRMTPGRFKQSCWLAKYHTEATLRNVASTSNAHARIFRFVIGAWLSLVEHLVRDQGVGGSNPLAPISSNCFRTAG